MVMSEVYELALKYLGVVSYFLILFYLSYLRLRASVVTVVSSRFGDVCLFFVIALSFWCGINKLAWLIIFFFIILTKSARFPFIRHGVSKCLLFMLVGDIMRGTRGSQARNCIYSSPLYGPWGIFSLFSIILGLSGAPFIGVFFTKHLLLRGFSSFIKFPVFLFITLCVFLSYLYSFRLCAIISKVKISVSSGTYFLCGRGVMVYL
ncbi:unnamed protein product [Schistocephalus solidus]|uniref:NADH:ubiquinone reductase (H(+)-translocating) n=1 Tax=Schistocephalus solidus TaxID=70667 RepID=A0A183TRW0_SCHSO|nr:unnamed protein product [Schistocephalus solidus]